MPIYSPPSDLQISMKGTAGGQGNNNIKIWSKSIVPTAAMNLLIDYSEAGFEAVTNIQVTVQRTSSSAMDVPNVALNTAPTKTGCSVNITQPNSALIKIAGIDVLSGSPTVAATNLSTITLYIRVEGY